MKETLDLTLPRSAAKGGWRLDADAVRDAAGALGVTEPVLVKLSGGRRTVGSHRWDLYARRHVVTVSTYESAAEATSTLWHELTHAAQFERSGGDWGEFTRRYRSANRRHGYHYNPYEVEARETSVLMTEEYPLTVMDRSRMSAHAAANAALRDAGF